MTFVFESYGGGVTATTGTASGRLPSVRVLASDTPAGNDGRGALRFGGRASSAVVATASGAVPRFRARAGTLGTDYGRGRLPRFGVIAYDTAIAPSVAFQFAPLPPVSGAGAASVTYHGTQDTRVPKLRGTGHDAGTAFGRGKLPMFGSGGGVFVPLQNYVTAVQSAGYVATQTLNAAGQIYALRDVVAVDIGGQTVAVTQVLRTSVALGVLPTALLEVMRAIESRVGLSALIDSVLAIQLTSGVGLTAALSTSDYLLLALSDALAIAGVAAETQEIDYALATILALLGQIDTPTVEQLASAFGAGSALAVDIEAYAQALSAVRLAAVADGNLLLTLALTDALGLGDTLDFTSELLRALESALGVTATLSIDGETYTAWVMSTESKAAWTYEDYPFNSFAQIGERYFAAGPDGISELVQGDDNGTPISWQARTGLLTMGTTQKKRIDVAYIGYTSDGTVGMSVVTTSPEGEKTQYNYTALPRTALDPIENRVKVGRGLESVYYQFVFAGTGSFTLHSARVLPMVLSRRI